MHIRKKIVDFLLFEKRSIKRELREDFYRILLKENYSRLSIISTLFFLLEIALYLVEDKLFNIGPIILNFLIISAVLIPIIWYIKIKSDTANLVFAFIIQYLFAGAAIIFGAAMALYVIGQTDVIHVYLLMVFFSAAFLHMQPLSSAILIVATYLFFFIRLPMFVSSPQEMFVIKINTSASMAAAWIMSTVLWRNRITLFVNKNILHKQNQILQELNEKDAMTMLYNHETSLKILEKELARSLKSNYPVSLIIADVDDFKNVNDNHGHLTGDIVLKSIANILENTVRKSDYVGRYGGEEFIIIMPDTDLDEAYSLAERIRIEVSQASHKNVSVTVSGGVSEFGGEAINDFIRLTDQKLYHAKRNGKNRFETEIAV